MSEHLNKRPLKPNKPLLITIDGPAGSGKTTVSRLLAKRLDYQYVDTGALYRCIAFEVNEAGVDPGDNRKLAHFCKDLFISFRKSNGKSRIFCNDRDLSDKIRTPAVTMLASAVSAMPAVREHLLVVQRQMGDKKSVVFEGRDMGTVVFPGADVKFYLDAAIGVRAQRRHKELTPQNAQSLSKVEKDMKQRDHNDSHRALAPLKPAQDAFKIDTTHLSIEGVVEEMLAHVLTTHC